MIEKGKLKSLISLFEKIKKMFPNENEKFFRFNLCFDVIVIVLVFVCCIGSVADNIINAFSSVLKTIHLNENIHEYYNKISSWPLFIIALSVCVLCFLFSVWYHYYDKKRKRND